MHIPELKELQSLSASHKKKHADFLKKLSQKTPKNLDSVVQDTHQEVFRQVDCLSCANCCKTTGPLFSSQDIGRLAKRLKMKESQFTQTYLRLDEDQDWVLKSVPCPFLGDDHYCSVYEDRPKACREYPHTDRKKIYQIRSITLKNTAICPAAFRVVEELIRKLPIR